MLSEVFHVVHRFSLVSMLSIWFSIVSLWLYNVSVVVLSHPAFPSVQYFCTCFGGFVRLSDVSIVFFVIHFCYVGHYIALGIS